MNVKIDRSRRPRRNYTVLVAVIAILLAIIIPTGLILLKNGFQKENPLDVYKRQAPRRRPSV